MSGTTGSGFRGARRGPGEPRKSELRWLKAQERLQFGRQAVDEEERPK